MRRPCDSSAHLNRSTAALDGPLSRRRTACELPPSTRPGNHFRANRGFRRTDLAPSVSTLSARNRNNLIQVVPPDFKARFFRSPILAVWRGVGNSIHGGFPAVALCLASTYSSRVHSDRYDAVFIHILSYHQTQGTRGGTPVGLGHHPKLTGPTRTQRGRQGGRTIIPPPRGQQKPGERVWM